MAPVDPSEGPLRAGLRWPAIGYGTLALLAIAVVAGPSTRLVNAPFPGFLVWNNGVLMSLHRLGWTGPSSDLPLNGGVLQSVEGEPFRGVDSLRAVVEARPAGTVFEYEVDHEGERRSYRVASMRFRAVDYLLTLGVYLLNAVPLLTVGFLALWLRPDRASTRALATSTGVLGVLLLLAIDYVTVYRFGTLCRIAEGIAPAALLNLALAFPSEALTSQRRRRITLALAALGALAALFVSTRFHGDPELARSFAVGAYIGIAGALLILVVRYAATLLRSRAPRRRAQAAVVFVGGFPAFALAALGMLSFTLFGTEMSWSLVFALLPLAPISMLYAMVRQDLFDAERFVRLSAGYAVATAATLVAFAGGLTFVDAVLDSDAPPEPGFTFLFVVGIALLFNPLRLRIQSGIDWLFYRSRVDPASELEGLAAALAHRHDEGQIADYVAQLVERDLRLFEARLELDGQETEAGAIRQPVVFEDARLATLVCGAKRSGTPFSPGERDLVRSIADQTALALHNARTIRDLREAQATLRTQERLATLGEFAGSIAHGIRNPLASIRVATEVAESGGEAPERAVEALRTVRGEVDRLEHRIRSLLQFTRPHPPDQEPTDLRQLAREVAASASALARRQQIELTAETCDEPCVARVDPDQLREALLELVTNAIRAQPDGGEIRIVAEQSRDDVWIEVVDAGPGIPESRRDRVFELFYTTRRDGSGIGLASVRKLVEANGGRARLVTTGPGGTRFRVAFPAMIEAEGPP